MASLKALIKEYRKQLQNDNDWIVFYKEKNKWNAYAIGDLKGTYDDGYWLNTEELNVLNEILGKDFKAICINKMYLDETENVNKMEEKIIQYYLGRMYQLNGDFLGDLVIED